MPHFDCRFCGFQEIASLDLSRYVQYHICDMEYRKGPYCRKLYFGLIFHMTSIYS